MNKKYALISSVVLLLCFTVIPNADAQHIHNNEKSVPYIYEPDDFELLEGFTVTGSAWRTERFLHLKDNVRYPFGYGLSYTYFKYNNVRLSKNKCLPTDIVKVSVDISNTGNMDGDEVVQLYVKCLEDKDGPSQQLEGFKRVHLKKDATETVSIELPLSTLEKWQTKSKGYQVKLGKYELRLGSSSADIHQRINLEITDP